MAVVTDGPSQEVGDEENEGVDVAGHGRVGAEAEVGAARVLHKLCIPLSAAHLMLHHALVRHESKITCTLSAFTG